MWSAMSVKSDKHKRCTRTFDNSSVELNLNLNLLTTTHHNNDSTYEQSYNAKNNNTDTCIHNIRVMSIEQ